MKTDEQIRANIMGRVHRIHFLRRVANPALKLGGLVAVFLLLLQSVSLGNIVSNAIQTSGIPGFLNFALSAFTDTEPTVQGLLLIALVLGAWIVYEQFERRTTMREMGIL